MTNPLAFELVRPVKLIPLTGKTVVNVETDGHYKMEFGDKGKPRKRDDKLFDTGTARLYQTPNGEKRKVLVTLPTDETSCETVVNEVFRLSKIVQ